MSTVVVTVTGPAGCCCQATGCVLCGVTTYGPFGPPVIVTFSGTGCVAANLPSDPVAVAGGIVRQPQFTGPEYRTWGAENFTNGCPTGFSFFMRCVPAGLDVILQISDLGPFGVPNSIQCGPCDYAGPASLQNLGEVLAVTTPGPVCDATGFVSQQFTASTSAGDFIVTVVAS